MAFRIHRGIWQFQKPDGAYESKYKLNDSGQLVETDADGNETGGMTASVSWTSVSGRPTALSSFTNDLGNYGGWLTTSGKAADANLLDGTDSSGFLRTGGGTLTGQLNLHAGSYEGSIVFGSASTWRTGIRQHDDGDAELRIWAKNANGMIFLATGYDGEPASIARPTDGLAIQGNKLGIGNFSAADPEYKLHVKGDIYANGGWVRVSGSDGLYFESYGGGWRMTDSSWIRAYNDKNIYTGGKLEVAGSVRADSSFMDDHKRFAIVGGGYSVNNPGGTGGAIKIELPTAVYGVNCMMSMTVHVYEYSTGQSFTIKCGGYNYYTHDWYNVFAYMVNDSGKGSDVPVYFGNNGSRDVIWIGEPGWSWSYPNVFITDFQAGHSQNENWKTGWRVSFDTAARTNVTASRTAHRQIDTGTIGSQSVNYASSAGNADTVDGWHRDDLRAWGNLTGVPSTFSPSAHTHDDRYYTESEVDSLLAGKQAAGSYAASNHNHTYNVNDSWLRDNGDNANVKLYGNSRQMVFRTDGTSEYASGVGGYAFAWMYGGDNASNRRMLLASDGRLWTSYHGWMDDAFQPRGSYAASSHTHAISEVTGLQSALDGKQAAGSYVTSSGEVNRTYRAIIQDTRAGQRSPNDYDDYRVSWEFTNQMPHDSNWLSVMTMQGWHDGYAAWQIQGPATSAAQENWYLRSGINTSWNEARTIIHSGNIGSQSVNYAGSAGSVAWGNVSGKPSTFSPSAHTHDDRYYTESESDARFATAAQGAKADSALQSLPAHTHDDRYYTESEVDSLLAGKQAAGSYAAASHTHDYVPLAGGTMSGTLTLKDISGVSQTVPNSYGAYLHLGTWGDGRTAAGAVLVNTAYRADYATSLFDMNISRFTNNSGYITAYGAQGANGNFYIDDNYGNSVVGVYASTRYQGVYAMGDAYKLAADGTSPGSLYGIAWTHTNVGGESKSGLGHQALFMMNGRTYTAIGSGIWTDGTITTTSHGTSANWKTAYDWGNHASAGYLTSLPSHNHDGSYLPIGGKAADSNLLDGLDLHTGRNNEANKVVRTDGNGYIQAGWINTTSGDNGTTAIARIYASQDGYIRYYTPANFRALVTDGVYQRAGDYAETVHTHTPSQVGLGNVSNAAQVTTSYNSSLNSDSRNSRGVTRLYRRDSDSDYSVQTYWTGARWRLYGYNGDSNHADTHVGYADSAGSASSASSASSATTAVNLSGSNVYTSGNNLYIQNGGVNNYRVHHTGDIGVFDVTSRFSIREMSSIWSATRYQWGDYMSYAWFDVDPWGDNWGIGGNPTSWKTVNRGSFLTFGFEDWSDRRHKSAIVEIDNAVDKVKAISGYTYWKRGSEVREAGVIAQDVLAVLPEAVGGTEEGYSVKPAALIGLLMKAVKEQQETIDALTARIEALENK